MKKYLNNIKRLITDDIIFLKKNRYHEENHKLKTYFEICRQIVEAQGGEARAKYGDNLIKEWSKELTNLYGKGYDYTNLSRMRRFYLLFRNIGPSGQLSWSHYRYILPIKDESKRNYYINLCIKQNLTKNQLIAKIKSNEFERLEYKSNIKLITNKNQEITIKDMIKNPIQIMINKDIDKLSEIALKGFILDKIEEFLLELGFGFSFVGSEVKLGDKRCDLLFFNFELNSFIVIELKTRELRHINIGQIEHYINYINKNIKKDYMNDTIGLILCNENNEIVLKYASDERIYSSTYKLIKEKEITQ